MDLVLHTDASYRNDLDTGKFARMLDDPSQCYKFYWLEAILNLLLTEEGDISFEKIIDEMICDAWYSVTRYKLHLGPTIRGKCENALERAINVINRDDQMSYASSKDEIMHGIEQHQAEIRADKLTLTINVPYRLLSSFLDEIGGSNKMWYKSGEMIRYISLLNQDTALPYIIIDGKGLEKKIRIHPEWRRLIIDNYPIIKGWIQMKKVRFLQDRNPGVPGIIYKLASENENGRKLSNAKALWKEVAEVLVMPIHDIYSGQEIDVRKSDLDHFVPWSFVANDELWDLIPMERRLNSSKSNRLPESAIWRRSSIRCMKPSSVTSRSRRSSRSAAPIISMRCGRSRICTFPETPRSSSRTSSSITCDRSMTPRSCKATDCGDIQIMWLSDKRNVENHVALKDEYVSDVALRRKTGHL